MKRLPNIIAFVILLAMFIMTITVTVMYEQSRREARYYEVSYRLEKRARQYQNDMRDAFLAYLIREEAKFPAPYGELLMSVYFTKFLEEYLQPDEEMPEEEYQYFIENFWRFYNGETI
jgi:hypothetical protein